jgi:hypothetical protein
MKELCANCTGCRDTTDTRVGVAQQVGGEQNRHDGKGDGLLCCSSGEHCGCLSIDLAAGYEEVDW